MKTLPLSIAIILLLAGSATHAGTTPQKPSLNSPKALTLPLGGQGDFIRMNHISVNKKTREISIEVQTVLDHGILEYLLVGAYGKTHETLFAVDGNLPSQLNFALILIGCEPAPFDVFMGFLKKKDGLALLAKKYPNSLVALEVRQNGEKIPLDELMRDRQGGQNSFTWIYTGGYFTAKQRYAADFEHSYIAVWPDVVAVINLFSTHKNPYRGNFGFEINEKSPAYKKAGRYTIILRRMQ